ncbi:MAG TPA: hypothetical protein VNZ53_46985 [Steroidobacteraceae bacterium]|nr:hypothetical protein [Steroidobacteraceae bacterium]
MVLPDSDESAIPINTYGGQREVVMALKEIQKAIERVTAGLYRVIIVFEKKF